MLIVYFFFIVIIIISLLSFIFLLDTFKSYVIKDNEKKDEKKLYKRLMIINCECGKKFNVDSSLISKEGRLLKCGSCSKIWHYTPTIETKNDEVLVSKINENVIKNKVQSDEAINDKYFSNINEGLLSKENTEDEKIDIENEKDNEEKLAKKSNQNNKLLNKFENLEKKLNDQQKFLEKNFEINSKLKNEIDAINNKIDIELENQSENVSNNIPDVIEHSSSNRVDFYQEENLRLGSELIETKKKFEILKSELGKYEDQRSNLISKINSINDELNNSNILTNVFKNNVQPEVQITDHNKIQKKEVDDLNEQVKAIFSKKI